MLETIKTLITNQYEAALSMLKACVDKCPDTVWNGPVAAYRFRQVVLHTLFFTDLYLGPNVEAFRRQRFHLEHGAFFGDYSADYEPFEDPAPRPYDKASLLVYLEFCRRKVIETLSAETAETLSRGVRWPAGWMVSSLSRAERHLYNIRHIQHHTAQLSLRLRLGANEGVDWVGSGWHDAAAHS